MLIFRFPFSVLNYFVLLAIDIGNTNTTLGVYDGENLVARWRMNTIRDRTADEAGVLARQMFAAAEIDYRKISAVLVASVVPPLNLTFQKMCETYFGLQAIFVDNSLDLGLRILYRPPSAVGADRLVDAVAAVARYGAPCIVVDFGTATTFDAVNSKLEYLGGVITPGIAISSDALFARAARLPRVEIKKPGSVIGSSTTGALQSGLYYGYAGMVDGILRRMIEELGEKPRVVATGGLAPIISPACQLIETIDDNLMLEGLRLIYQKLNENV